MLLFQGRISPRLPPPPPAQKKNMTLCVIGRARFERNCGNIYSRHLFLLGGLGFWDRYWRDAGQLLVYIFPTPKYQTSLQSFDSPVSFSFLSWRFPGGRLLFQKCKFLILVSLRMFCGKTLVYLGLHAKKYKNIYILSMRFIYSIQVVKV